MIHFENVTKKYLNGNSGILNVSFKIEQGEFVFLTGASGSGKSTIIRLIYREIHPTEGFICVTDKNICTLGKNEIQLLRRSMGVVFQDFKLIKTKTIKENLVFALEAISYPKDRIIERVEEVLETVELLRKQEDYPFELSGGEQQRASIARAIINNPSIILADEPTGNLDEGLSRHILKLFNDINQKYNTTILFATHDKPLISMMDKRILFLKYGVLNEYKD